MARIFNTYKSAHALRRGRVVSNLVCKALAGEDMTIYGDSSQTRSLPFFTDLIDGLVRLMESDGAGGAPLDLGNPNELTVRSRGNIVLAMSATRSRVVYRPLQVDDPCRWKADISRALGLLNWQPTVSLERGLKAKIAWFEDEANRMASPMFFDAPLVATAAE